MTELSEEFFMMANQLKIVGENLFIVHQIFKLVLIKKIKMIKKSYLKFTNS